MPAQLAKGALRRLALERLEPTPANYARAYAEEAGQTAPADSAPPGRARPVIERLAQHASDDSGLRAEMVAALMAGRWDALQQALDRAASAAADPGPAWAGLIDRLARGLDRGGRHWTGARKKQGLQQVLDGSRSDAARLQRRLTQLIGAWETDRPDGAALPGEPAAPADATNAAGATDAALAADAAVAADGHSESAGDPVADLVATVRCGLPADEPRAAELADELALLADRLAREGPSPPLVEALARSCARVQRLFGLRHELVDELLALCRSLTDGLGELAEDGSWAQGQGQGLRQRLDDAGSARAVRAARGLLDDTRERQRALLGERQMARDAFKQVIAQMLGELAALGNVTGRFNSQAAGYAELIAAADSLPSLASVVREMVDDSRAVHEAVAGARDRLSAEHARAAELQDKVRLLEAALRRLSDEVGTDALTQVANRRGLARLFEAERARVASEGDGSGDGGDGAGQGGAAPLVVGLLDIDNFKRLNDTLGHAAGDVALKSLAAQVSQGLRPGDHLARFGGEEFVVLLPATAVDEAQQLLTRLQRGLSASLFMHEGREVFVTFSAGVSAYRPGEALEQALQRADEGLYEAKRTGKNRTCIG